MTYVQIVLQWVKESVAKSTIRNTGVQHVQKFTFILIKQQDADVSFQVILLKTFSQIQIKIKPKQFQLTSVTFIAVYHHFVIYIYIYIYTLSCLSFHVNNLWCSKTKKIQPTKKTTGEQQDMT